jgi:subtilisin family serine protease
LNAIVIRMDASKISKLRKMPGVKQVSLAPVHYIENATSVPFIGANTVWDSTGALSTLGLTGNGVTIAVIDTGVDYLHANFAGTMNYTGQDATVINSDGIAFPTAKVIDGWDFAGENYDASGTGGSTTPVPDPDPTDCNGHGSHVAGSATGIGVDGGITYTGGYDNLSPATLAGFEIGPGVAPEASIVALKVFGCTGSTNLVLQAIERAVDPNDDEDLSDHYNVINMSLGSSFGFAGYEEAIQNAVAAGVIVVTSAGNSGDTHYITGTPGATTEAISVAASSDSGLINSALAVDANADNVVDNSYYAVQQSNYSPGIPGTAPGTLTLFQKPSDANGLGCNAADFSTFTSGNVAFINRGTCSGKLKAFNAQTAGASAVVIVSTDNNPVSLANDGAVAAITIPVVMIASASGSAISPSIGTAKGQLIENGGNSADIIASFSSRGVRRKNLTGELLLKPDITAPGVSIFSTKSCYTGDGCLGNEGSFNSGTSMASPHVAGVMALLRQQYPSWSVEDLKALVMSTATSDLFALDTITGATGQRWGTSRVGSGRVDVENATTEQVIAYNTDNSTAVGVTFNGNEFLNNLGPQTENKTVTVENNAGFSVTYNLSIDTVNDATGVAFSVSPSSITVPAMSSNTFTVTATYTPASMTHVRDVNSSAQQGTFFRHWISEETGYAVLDASSGATVDLRVPLYAAPRPASDMDSPTLINTGATTGTVSIPLTGTEVNNGSASTLYRSRVVAFEHLFTSPEVNPGPDLWDGGDIQHVGVSSDIPVGGARSYFGISMYGEWDAPRMREVQICLDLNQDATGGAMGDGTDWCWVARPEIISNNYTDVFTVYLKDINNFLAGGANAEYSINEYQNVNPNLLDTRIFNNNVMFLASGTSPAYWNSLVGAGTVKYTGGNTTDPDQGFDFKIMTLDFNDPDAIPNIDFTDSTPMLTFDPSNSVFMPVEGYFGIAGRMVPMVDDLNATAFDFAYNLTQPDGAADVLMLHLYNQSGDRVDLVTIQAPPSVPVLIAPANGLTTNNSTPTFDWTDSTGGGGAAQYQIQIDNNNDFSSPEIDTNVAVSTFTPGGALANNTYFWRVRSAGATGAFSAWSTVWSVTIDANFPNTLTVAGAGTGNGTITDTIPGGTINCTSTGGVTSNDCTEQALIGTAFTLVATPIAHSEFAGWTGCDSTSGANNEICDVTLNSDTTVTANFELIPYLLFDDFEDGIMDWKATESSCQELNGSLVCSGKKPAFAPVPWTPSGALGCITCLVESDVQTTGGAQSSIKLMGWYGDNSNNVVVILKQDQGKVSFKQKSGGVVVAKKSVPFTITPGVTYKVGMSYTGTHFVISVDDVPVITVPAGTTPLSGNVGYKATKTTITVEEIRIRAN